MGRDLMTEEWERQLGTWERHGLRRRLHTVTGAPGRVIELDGRDVLNFSSNNYLGLADHPALADAAIAALRGSGAGTGASRLIVGNHRDHEELEMELASFHDCEAALLFNSGYNANVGVLQAVVRPGDVIFSDALNHASIIDGCRLSRAHVVVYPHKDVAALRELMSHHGACSRVVVTDSVFSMDGDRAPLRQLSELCRKESATLIVDEAHATAVLGPEGRGLAAEAGVVPDVRVGTLGKAFGSFGAYVAGSRALVELLIHKARSFVFTTSLPVSVVAATRASLRLIGGREGMHRRRHLAQRMERFRTGLLELGLLAEGAGATPIFPIMVGDQERAMECSAELLSQGIHAQGIRPPTVPRGTSRLRFALMATHTHEDIDRALAGIQELTRRGSISRSNG